MPLCGLTLNSVWDTIIAILQYDLMNIFSTQNPNQDSSTNCLRYGYDPRPRIYEGQSTLTNIDEIANCLNSHISVMECEQIANGLFEGNENDKDIAMQSPEGYADNGINSSPESAKNAHKPHCNFLSNAINPNNSTKSSHSKNPNLETIEKEVQLLWTAVMDNIPQCSKGLPINWQNIRAHIKLPFYWAVLTNETVRESPFENFKRFYVENMSSNANENHKKTNEEVLITWHSMTQKQKLPFVMEAFIALASAGKVNFTNELELKNVWKNLLNKCG
ncbi:uncharacterized protein LOC106090939 [Stomoxys calcitrans]|uniref:uncharacterized protein LOC106090939 n=1 Tax=Stomoxys calcitrans TaxID=35570 RepID=UPI0027E34C08|nr:uncharacterized protein LOC106090939 [Stomoxys calcitrans]